MRAPGPRVARWAPAVALVTVLGLLLTGLGLALYLDRANQLLRISEITVQARTLAATIPAALAFGDRRAAQEYVNAVHANPNMANAGAYDAKGQLFVYWSQRGMPPPPPTLTLGPPSVSKGHIIVTVPVVQNQMPIGGVYLESTIEPVTRRLERYALIGSLVSMAALFVGMLGFAQHELGRANAGLASQADSLAEANASLRHQIAEREKVEAALRQAQKMEAIGQLTGGVAHDFNNLLQVILGNLDRLTRRIHAETAGSEGVRMITSAVAAAERAAVLTQRLLAFSRRQPLAPKPLDINQLVSGVLDLVTRTIGETTRVQTRLDGGVWRCFADENQLENALLNLAVNARDAMPRGGQLVIETSNATLTQTDIDALSEDDTKPGQYVRIAVTDTGAGMPPEILSRVFEPFFTTKGVGQGTGLGLSQVYGFVRQSGGVVKIDSVVGKGTQVSLFLPRLEADQPLTGRSGTPTAIPSGSTDDVVLLVEDQQDVRAVTAATLRDLGYTVTEAPDGHAALAILRADTPISLLLTDLGLPGSLDGRELVAAASRLRPGLKVLFMTGYARTIVHYGRMESGLEVVSKPFTRAELAHRVRAILDRASPGITNPVTRGDRAGLRDRL